MWLIQSLKWVIIQTFRWNIEGKKEQDGKQIKFGEENIKL